MSLNLDRRAWKRVAFGDVVRNVNVTVKDPQAEGIDRVVAMEHLDSGELQIARWGDLESGTTFTRRVRPGQTLFGKRRAYQRKAAYAEFDAICSGDILVFEADATQVLPEFLPFIVQSNGFYDHALGTSAGSLSPRTNWQDLSNHEFLVPTLEEQDRLRRLLWAVQSAERKQHNVMRCVRLAGKALIEEVRRNTSQLRPLSAVAGVANGQNFPKQLQGRSEGEVPFFKVSDLDSPGNERWLTTPSNWISKDEAAALKARLLPAGTVVTVRVGAALRLERRRMLSQPALVDENHLVITPKGVDSKFLWAVLSETPLSDSRNDGVVPSLNQRIVGSVLLPVLPESEYERLGSLYSDIHDGIAASELEIKRLRQVRSAVLNSIFGDPS